MTTNKKPTSPRKHGVATGCLATLAVVALLVVCCGLWVFRSVKQTDVSLAVDQRINATPVQIESIKSIGEWEFLSVSDEELVDTVRKGFFSDDHLVRIYYGTLRLGINTHWVKPGWITTSGDTLKLTLPEVTLLSHDFIDEARTKSFYESGRWSHNDHKALYQKAYRQMLRQTLTPQNLRTAQENGEAQLKRMMKAMGYDHVSIEWKKSEPIGLRTDKKKGR